MKKTDSYNKYVPLFIDNYAEQRSAKLRARMGWAGYGIYLAILQRLRSEKECVLELDYESLAFSFWTDEETLRTIIEDFGLFAINREKGCFFSPLLDEMLLSIDPALAKARNKKYAVQVPANEDIMHDSPRKSAKKGVLEGENSMEYPANEDITHDISQNSAKKDFSDGETIRNILQMKILHRILTRACALTNKQTNKQTNKRKKREEKSSPFPPFSQKRRRGEHRRMRRGKFARMRAGPPRLFLIPANERQKPAQPRLRCL